MKRSTVLLVSCLVLAGGSGWLAHMSGVSPPNPRRRKRITITQSQLDKYVADKVAKAVARNARRGQRPATDDQVLNPLNWHKAIFNKAEYVVYTGPGQIMFHHWVEQLRRSRPRDQPKSPGHRG